MNGMAAAVGPAIAAAVGPAVNAAIQPFLKTLAMTHNRLAFLQVICDIIITELCYVQKYNFCQIASAFKSINGPLMAVSNAAGEMPGPLFPATVAEFEVIL